jgi:hypothetical protein
MIVVVASAHDVRARSIVAHWQSQGAAMLSVEDLCALGWRLTVPHEPSLTTAVVGGKTMLASAIDGIITLRPCIFPEELHDVDSRHRKYVAAECNAFLLAWLSAQSCLVLNRPTASCLSGPNWQPEQWVQLAAGLSIPAQTRRSIPVRSHGSPSGDTVEVISVGERCFGTDDPTLRCWTLKLAHAAKVELLSIRYSAEDGRFIAANIWPPLKDPAVLEAVLHRLEARP